MVWVYSPIGYLLVVIYQFRRTLASILLIQIQLKMQVLLIKGVRLWCAQISYQTTNVLCLLINTTKDIWIIYQYRGKILAALLVLLLHLLVRHPYLFSEEICFLSTGWINFIPWFLEGTRIELIWIVIYILRTLIVTMTIHRLMLFFLFWWFLIALLALNIIKVLFVLAWIEFFLCRVLMNLLLFKLLLLASITAHVIKTR